MAEAKYSKYYVYIKPVVENKFIRSVAPYIFSLATISIFLVFAMRPTITTISNLQKSIEKNQQVLEALKTKAANLEQGRKNLEEIDIVTRTKINTAVPNQTNIVSIITSLQKSSPKDGSASALLIQPIILFDTKPKEVAAAFKLEEASFSYNIQGSYAQLLDILTNLRKSPRVISIDNMSISKPSDDPAVLTITGKAYYIK